MSLVTVLAEGAEHTTRDFPLPGWGYGAIALGIFLILLWAVTRFDPDR